jgi:hypothetical protein
MANFNDFFNAGPGILIASIFPLPLRADRPYNGRTFYEIAAVENQNEIQTVRVQNAMENVYVGNGKYNAQPVFADDIAKDVLNEFSTGYVGQESGQGPGVWICSGPAPNAEEIEVARGRQTAYFDFLCQQAQGLHIEGKGNQITELHRRAARWLGYETFEWLEHMKQKALKECPNCFSSIDARATVCPVCTRDVVVAAPQQAEPKARKAA